MKALSIRQPWAWLIVNGHKTIENRSKRSHYRGPLLIHAGKALAKDPLGVVLFAMSECGVRDIPPIESMPRGGIVGRVEMIDCVTEHPSPYFFGPYGFVFERAEPLPFRPCRGQLGFFDVEMKADAA